MPQHRPGEVVGRAVDPTDPVVTPKPRPLPAHIAAGADERQLTGLRDLLGGAAGIDCVEHLGVAQRPAGRDTVPQTAVGQPITCWLPVRSA